jgi:hypothetical protein
MPFLRALFYVHLYRGILDYFENISIRVLVKATKNDKFHSLIMWDNYPFIAEYVNNRWFYFPIKI